jgi:tRNA nucleotidyltransferase (CCA-adding enzyme)
MLLAHELSGLERFGPVLDALPGPAYLVGGTVRDLLLGRPSRFDFDLAVIGDAEEYARALAERLNGTVTTHGRFGTATVRYESGLHVDVAAARSEIYPAPAALPEVTAAATIAEDLGRRDFTINAMAVSLPDAQLVDPFDGEQHLRDRLVRVLHDNAFVDDPTRIFRAARYEARLRFRMDPKSEKLALVSVPNVRRLSGARVREELYAIFAEEDGGRALGRLRALGVDDALGMRFPERGELLGTLHALNERYRLGFAPEHLGLLAIDAPAPTLDELKVERRLVYGVNAAHRDATGLREGLSTGGLSPAEIVEAVESTGPDTALYALALGDLPGLREYFERLRSVRLELDGDDLAALGLSESPRVGEVLTELRRRKLNGQLDGRAAELAAARELIAE